MIIYSELEKRKIFRVLLWGILFRFIFMPFTTSTDLLWPYHRGYLWITGKLTPRGLNAFPDYVHGVFLLLLKPFLYPFFHSMWNIPWGPTHPHTPDEVGQMLSTFFTFVSQPGIFYILFFLKLPYLVFDLLCAWVIFKLIGEEGFRFWMWNPVIIFISAIYGRYESVVLFLLLLSFYYFKREQNILSLFYLSLSILFRLYPVILLPYFLKPLGRKSKKEYLGCLFLIIPLLYFIFNLRNKGGGLPHLDYLLAMNFFLGLHSTIYIFPLGYLLLLLHFLKFGRKEDLALYFALLHLWLFSTCYFHLQFFAWLIPFLTLTIAGSKYKEGVFYFSLLFYFLYTFQWGKVNSVYLFAPLNPLKVFYLPSLKELISPALFHKLMGLVRTALSACLLWLMYLLWREKNFNGLVWK